MKDITYTSDLFDFSADAEDNARRNFGKEFKYGDVSILRTSGGYIYVVYGAEYGEKVQVPVKEAKSTKTKVETKAPKSGTCKMVWDIANACKIAAEEANKEYDRGAILAECQKRNINLATARTQLAKWFKAQNTQTA